MDQSSTTKEPLEIHKVLAECNYKEPANGNFRDCTKEVVKQFTSSKFRDYFEIAKIAKISKNKVSREHLDPGFKTSLSLESLLMFSFKLIRALWWRQT